MANNKGINLEPLVSSAAKWRDCSRKSEKDKFVSEFDTRLEIRNIENDKQLIEVVKQNKNQPDISAASYWNLAKFLLEEKGIDCRAEFVGKDPYDFDELIYLDKKDFLQKLLQSDKLNLYKLDTCLHLDKYLTMDLLSQDKKLEEKVDKLFDDNETFYIQEKIAKEGLLEGIVDTKKKFAATEKRVSELSGKEVFKIWRNKLEDIADYANADLLYRVTSAYYQQVEDLSMRDNGADLHYSHYGSYGSSLWNNRGDFLNIIGMFKDDAVIEEEIEKRVGRLYGYFAYPPREGCKDKPRPTERTRPFSYVSSGDGFLEEMKKSLKQDPQSVETKFYINNFPEVALAQNKTNVYTELFFKMAPKLIDEHPELCAKWWKQIGRMKSVDLSNALKQIAKDPDSNMSKLYLDGMKDVLSCLSNRDLAKYAEGVIPIVQNNKEKRPDLCQSLVNSLAVSLYNDNYDINWHEKDAICDLYLAYPTKEMAQALEKTGPIVRLGIEKMAQYAAATGFDSYKKALEKRIAEYKDRELELGEYERYALNEGFTYQILFEQLAKAKVSNLSIGNLPKDFNTEGLLQDKDLISLTLKGKKIEHPEKLIEGLPNLQYLELSTNGDGTQAIYESLLRCKPEKLERLYVPLPKDKADELMEKYPDLNVYGGSENLRSRNMNIIKIKKSKEPMKEAIEEGLLAVYLQVVPEDKRPSIDDVVTQSCLDVMREKYKEEDYYAMLGKLSEVAKPGKNNRKIALVCAVADNKVVEYLESLKSEDRPSLAEFYEPNDLIFNNSKEKPSLLDIIRDNSGDKEEQAYVIGRVLSLLHVDKKDIEIITDRVDNIEGAVKEWQEQKALNQASQASLDAFRQWQAQQAKSNK